MFSYQDLWEMFQELASDVDATNKTVAQRFINVGVKKLQVVLDIYFTEETRTFTTVTDAISGTSDQAYKLPENFHSLTDFYVTVGTTQYRADLIQDDVLWRQINSTTTQSESNFVQFVFIRQDRIELYPIPSSANTATIWYQAIQKDLTKDDYTTGTITTLTNGATAVTGSGTTWTSAMIGRFFKINDDGQWYEIATRTSNTVIGLDTKYQGVSIASGSDAYTIGQMPNLPPDTHELPVYYAVWKWALFKKDVQLAREFERMWKEGIRDATGNWANRGTSKVIPDRRILRRRGLVNPNFWPGPLT